MSVPGIVRSWKFPNFLSFSLSFCWVLAFFIVFPSRIHATEQPPAFSGYTKRTWQVRDGLPEQTVQSFAQTPDGYLWIGTTGGLVRFDGARFVVYDHENTPLITENSIFCLLASKDGALWLGTEGGGLIHSQNGIFRSYSAADGLTNGFIRKIFEDSKGAIWIGTDNGLFKFLNGRIERVDGVGDVPLVAIHAIAEDHLGRLWVGGSRLLMFDGAGVHEYQLKGLASQNRVKSILEAADGTIYVGTVSGLQRMLQLGIFEKVNGFSNTVRVLRETSDRALWAGTIGSGVVTSHGNASFSFSASSFLPSNTVLDIFEDKEKNVWVGTQAGMLRLSKTPVSVVSLPDATDSDFGTIYQDPEGVLWVASTHLYKLSNGVAVPYAFPGLSGVKVRNLLRAKDGSWWLGTDGSGVYRLNKDHLEQFTTRQGLTNNFSRALLEDRSGNIWIAADEGVNEWTPHGFINYQVKDGLCYFSTRVLFEDHAGDIWVGTDRGVSHLHNGVFENDPATDALKQEKVWSIHEDSDNGLWFGTRSDGLFRYKSGNVTHYTVAQGLGSDSIYQILEDKKGNFWTSGPNGISLLNRHELDAMADGSSQHLSIRLYGLAEEGGNTELYGGTQSAGTLSPHGDVWFPSNKGPIHIAPEQTSRIPLPPVRIEQVLADGRAIPDLQKIELDPRNSRLEVSYAPILLGSQDEIRFRYKLEGFEENWNTAGSRRIAYYTNLPPGKYTLRIAVFAADDSSQSSEVTLPILQRPHFYRTPAFIGVCILMLGLLIWGLHRFRLRQMHGRFHAVLEERTRLAREMHDTLIQGCASVSALLEAVTSLGQTDDNLKRDLLGYARTQVRTTIDEARQVVWNLRRGDESSNDIVMALGKMCEQLSKEFSISVECHVEGEPFPLNQSISHELLMVARESVYNAALHAHPSKVQVHLAFGKDELILETQDDGCGFDFDSSLMASDRKHYGILGMQERMKRIGGEFELSTNKGNGTRVRVQVPRTTSIVQDLVPGD
ncbi:MAG TPA: two-component regulator propeller domain-containing protein [Terriglobales bacterium]